MAVSLLSVAAAAASSSSPSSSSLLHLCNKFPNLSIDHIPYCSSPIKFPSTLKSKPLILNARSFHSPFPSLQSPASAAFDSLQVAEENPSSSESPESEDDAGVEEEQRNRQSDVNGRLFVGNLPYAITSTQLEETFGEAGRVTSVEIIYDRVTDRSRGFGFVTMGTVEEAQEAIRLFNGSQLGGRTMKVNFPEVPRGGEREVMGPKIRNGYQGFIDTPHKIYAGNLSWNLTSQGLKDAFANLPGFLSAKVIYERDSRRSRGFGFITFASATEVESALNAMNGVEIERRPLRLNLATVKPPPSSSPPLESKTGDNVDSSELFSSMST